MVIQDFIIDLNRNVSFESDIDPWQENNFLFRLKREFRIVQKDFDTNTNIDSFYFLDIAA